MTSGTATATRRASAPCAADAAEEEPGQRQEDVDTTGDPAEPHVKHRDERDRDAAQAVEVVSVEARRARALPGSRRGGGVPGSVTGAGRGGARVIMVDGQSTEVAGDSCHGRCIAAGEQRIRLVPCRVDARRDQRDRRRARLASLQHRSGAEALPPVVAVARKGAWLTLIDDGAPDRGARRDGVVVDRDPRPRPPGAGRGDHRPARDDEPRHVRRADARTRRPAGPAAGARSRPTGSTPCSSATPARCRWRSPSRWRCSTGAVSAAATSTG